MSFTLVDNQKLDLTIVTKDSQGHEVPATGSFTTATVSDPTVATASISGSVVTLVTTGALGTGVSLTVTDGTIVSEPFVFDVVVGPASTATLTPGTAVAR